MLRIVGASIGNVVEDLFAGETVTVRYRKESDWSGDLSIGSYGHHFVM